MRETRLEMIKWYFKKITFRKKSLAMTHLDRYLRDTVRAKRHANVILLYRDKRAPFVTATSFVEVCGTRLLYFSSAARIRACVYTHISNVYMPREREREKEAAPL